MVGLFLHLLTVAVGGGPVLSLLALLLVRGIGSSGGGLGLLGPLVLLPWPYGLLDTGLRGSRAGRPLRIRVIHHVQTGVLEDAGVSGGQTVSWRVRGSQDHDDILTVLGDQGSGHGIVKVLQLQLTTLLDISGTALGFDEEVLQLINQLLRLLHV